MNINRVKRRWRRFKWHCKVAWGRRHMFVWRGNWGVAFYPSDSFARYDAKTGTPYGPYTLWFKRWCGPIYRAIAPPARPKGITIL